MREAILIPVEEVLVAWSICHDRLASKVDLVGPRVRSEHCPWPTSGQIHVTVRDKRFVTGGVDRVGPRRRVPHAVGARAVGWKRGDGRRKRARRLRCI